MKRTEIIIAFEAGLKPCPFYGSRAQIIKSYHPGFPDGIFNVECRKCSIITDRNYTRIKNVINV